MKFALYIDNKTTNEISGYSYNVMKAATLEEAIEEADKAWNDGIYLAQIMKKEGKIEKENGCKVETFAAILCRRSHGWHLNNKENCESKHTAKHYTAKYGDWFEAC